MFGLTELFLIGFYMKCIILRGQRGPASRNEISLF